MSNGQKKQRRSAASILEAVQVTYDAQQDSALKAKGLNIENDRNAKGENQQVDDVLASLYGPISSYTNKDSLYADYARVYESGINSQERNLSGFDPVDFASSKEWGNQSMRNQALRGGREVQYDSSPGSAYSMYGYMPKQKGYGEPWLPGYSNWKDIEVDKGTLGGVGKLNPNSMEDYFYDLAFQDVLKGQVVLGNKAQGYTWLSTGNTSNTKNNLRQLKKLVGADNYDTHIDDISTQAAVKARDWLTQYRSHSKGEMGKSIKAVETRQNVLKNKESIQDLNETIIRKMDLDKTKKSLDAISPKDATNAASAIYKETQAKLNERIKNAAFNPSADAEKIWLDFAGSGDYADRGAREISVLNSMITDEESRIKRSTEGKNEFALFEKGGRMRAQGRIDDYKSWIEEYKKSGTSERKKSFKY